MVFHYPLALLWYLFHTADLFQKVLVLEIVFDLDLFEGVSVLFYSSYVDLSIASAQFLVYFYIFQAKVSFQHFMVSKKIKHKIKLISL